MRSQAALTGQVGEGEGELASGPARRGGTGKEEALMTTVVSRTKVIEGVDIGLRDPTGPPRTGYRDFGPTY